MSLGDRVRRYGRAHGEAAIETYYFLARRSLSSLLVWLMIGLSLALPSGLYLIAYNLERVESDWSARPALNVYLKVGLSAEQIRSAGVAVRATPGVAAVDEVTADQALAQLRKQLPIDAELAALGGNPLPHSFLVAVEPGADIVALEGRLGHLPNVDQVVSERLWRERFSALTSVVVQMGWFLGGLLALTSTVVAGAAVRLAIDSRLEEIQVLRLFGATDAQVRRPFLYLGLWYGLGGGMLGALTVSIALGVAEESLAPLSRSYGLPFDVAGFDLPMLAVLVGGGALLGVIGAWFSAQWRARHMQLV